MHHSTTLVLTYVCAQVRADTSAQTARFNDPQVPPFAEIENN